MELDTLLRASVEALALGEVADEALAVLKPPRRVGPVALPMTFVAAGRAWRLGEVLLDRDARLYSTGSVTRAITPQDFAANKSPAEETRRELQRAAVRSKFRRGDTVNFGFTPLKVGDGVLTERDGDVLLKLAHAEVSLETYLADRIRFAITPGWD